MSLDDRNATSVASQFLQVDAYLLKRRLMHPYRALLRRLLGTRGWFLQAFEEHNYGPAFASFTLRYLRDPEILYTASVANVSTVFDVGAFDGAWAAKTSQRYGAQVYAFEPSPGMFRRASRKFGASETFHLFPYGLAAADGDAALVLRGPGSTVYAEALKRLEPDAVPARSARVQMRDVKEVIDELCLEELDFTKVNIEGGEYDLLDRLIVTGYIARCRCLLVQFHEWFPDAYARRGRIHRALRRTHTLDWSHAFVWERWTRRGEARVA